MLKFYAEPFLRLAKIMTHLEAMLDIDESARSNRIGTKMDEVFRTAYGTIRTDCAAMGFKSTTAQLDRIGQALDRGSTLGELAVLEAELYHRITDDFASHLLLHVDASDAGYFKLNQPFGPEVAHAFPDATIDIEEAGNCLALGRSTACVLHLMRAVEPLIAELARCLGVRYEFRGWAAIIDKMRADLETKYDLIQPPVKGNKEFFANALDRLTGMKDAVRNPSVHAQINYDRDRAIEVYIAVKSFMQLCAEGLARVSTPP